MFLTAQWQKHFFPVSRLGVLAHTRSFASRNERLARRLEARKIEITKFMREQVPKFESVVGRGIRRKPASILQMNIGLHCNQACVHCHVDSSPDRFEMMNRETAVQTLKLLEKSPTIKTVDITGGAPELNRMFRTVVSGARELGREVIDRCNLTVLFEPGQEYLPEYFVRNKIHIVASLPCYSKKNVNSQRGKGVFSRSISALELLNDHGYGKPDTGLILDLVYNPSGVQLPGIQEELEIDYKENLKNDYGIVFNNLFTVTNMPINRFSEFLYRQNCLMPYMSKLVEKYNPDTLDNLMCRDTINISWEGNIYDCDFNQQVQLPISNKQESGRLSVFDISSFDELTDLRVSTGPHCFGCTAGAGSGCQGSLA